MRAPTLPPAPGLDSVGMWELVLGLPEQVRAAAELAIDGVEGLPGRDEVRNVVVLGMGGSGMAGDVMAAVAAPFMPVPVIVRKEYEIPGFVGEGSLVFAISHSGETEETIEAVQEAAASGARIVGVTVGGQLAEMCVSWGEPVIPVPALPMPRAALGAMAVPPLLVLEQLGLFPGAAGWVTDAIHQLERRRDQLAAPDSAAAALARRIGRTLPLIYGAGDIGSVAAQRWKAQCNENAKTPAFANRLPEVCHNEIAGWGQHGDVTRQIVTLVHLRHEHEHPQNRRRFEELAAIELEVVHDVVEVQAEGEGTLAQLLDLVLIGDVVSLHLAYQAGVDPGPIPILDELKEALTR